MYNSNHGFKPVGEESKLHIFIHRKVGLVFVCGSIRQSVCVCMHVYVPATRLGIHECVCVSLCVCMSVVSLYTNKDMCVSVGHYKCVCTQLALWPFVCVIL